MNVTITPEALQKSATQYRKDLLMVPVQALSSSLQHMTLRPGIRHKEVVGELAGDMQFGPYSKTRIDDTDINIVGRTLETYLGSVVKNFSPNDVYQSIYGSAITKGEALKTADITRQVVAFLCAKLGANINKVLFTATRKDDGTTTADLFNGFDTIAATENTTKTISSSLGNLTTIEAITKANAVDVIKSFVRTADDELVSQPNVKIFVPMHVYFDYLDDYQSTVGAIPYNQKFEKKTIDGFDNVELVPLSNKKGAKFIQMTTQNNMLVGVNQTGEEENIEIARFQAFVLQFIATMFFGCQYESLSKERILFGTIDGATAI